MMRKNRPYLFYDTTTSVCTSCLRVVEAKILIQGGRVLMDKWCPAHGTERVLVSDDADYYRLCRRSTSSRPRCRNASTPAWSSAVLTIADSAPTTCSTLASRWWRSPITEYGPGFEVYLQFDSFQPTALKSLRGADLGRVHAQAIERLNELDISTTLVVTLKKGVNDGEIGKIIDFGLAQPCVRGVTLQPVQDAGRAEDYDPGLHRLTLSEIRRSIAEQSRAFTLSDIIPVPCNPDTLAMGYALKVDGEAVPLTRYVQPEILLQGEGSTITFEHDPVLKQRVFELFSTSQGPDGQASRLSELLCCLPRVQAPEGVGYRSVFRVLIVQFMDARSPRYPIPEEILHPHRPADGRLIPFESFNIFYRDDLARRLHVLRAEVAASARRRMAPIV
jgi:uncharacterized radical SAM superfamily Fe-S cluster-containing enzyme